MTQAEADAVIRSLYLFKCLIKDGCEWHGDTVSHRWSEVLTVPPGLDHQVRLTLAAYEEGKDYVYAPANDTGPGGGVGEISIA